MVAVVGRLFQKWFPAQPNLSYTFIWDKTDAYGQQVYGLSEAVGKLVELKRQLRDQLSPISHLFLSLFLCLSLSFHEHLHLASHSLSSLASRKCISDTARPKLYNQMFEEQNVKMLKP